jgi:TRAP-type C4-dicarboxylate transport system permease small subunit
VLALCDWKLTAYMTFPHSLVIISALLILWGGYAYFRDTLVGRTKPNRVSWFLWALAPLVSFGAAFSVDADIWASVRVLVGGVASGVIFLNSFFEQRKLLETHLV